MTHGKNSWQATNRRELPKSDQDHLQKPKTITKKQLKANSIPRLLNKSIGCLQSNNQQLEGEDSVAFAQEIHRSMRENPASRARFT